MHESDGNGPEIYVLLKTFTIILNMAAAAIVELILQHTYQHSLMLLIILLCFSVIQPVVLMRLGEACDESCGTFNQLVCWTAGNVLPLYVCFKHMSYPWCIQAANILLVIFIVGSILHFLYDIVAFFIPDLCFSTNNFYNPFLIIFLGVASIIYKCVRIVLP